MADIIYGYRTIFPIPLGLDATQNPSLIYKSYKTIGEYDKGFGIKVIISCDKHFATYGAVEGSREYIFNRI